MELQDVVNRLRMKQSIRRSSATTGWCFLVIHQLLEKRGVEYSETTVRRYIHRQFPSPVRPVMRRETTAGEVMEVDFGHLGLTWDVNTRSRRRTWVFSGRLRHSRRAYREVVFNQKQETFFACHIHAFEWFGGVAEKVTPDNLKAAVIVASFEDPLVNRAYRQLALHYGFLISPCLPYHPEHKGGVEGDMKYVKRNFLPLFREAQKERGHELPYSDELVDELEHWNRDSYDLHIVQKVGRTPLELFETEEAGALKPLPVERWDQVVCKEAGVGPDWRVQFEKAFYTVPYRLIGERVLVLGNSQVVRVFLDYEEVTAHPRATELWQVRRRPEHAPPELEQYLNLTHDGLVQWARRLGPSVALVAQEVFADKAVDGMRPVRALIRLADKYKLWSRAFVRGPRGGNGNGNGIRSAGGCRKRRGVSVQLRPRQQRAGMPGAGVLPNSVARHRHHGRVHRRRIAGALAGRRCKPRRRLVPALPALTCFARRCRRPKLAGSADGIVILIVAATLTDVAAPGTALALGPLGPLGAGES